MARSSILIILLVASMACSNSDPSCFAAREIETGEIESLRSKLKDLKPEQYLCDGKSLLSIAASSRRGYESSLVLLNSGASPNLKEESGTTPLHEAAVWADKRLVALLLAHGANPAAKDSDGATALDLARQRSDKDGIEIAELLSARQASGK